MRTIKFRGWHREARKMLYDDSPGDCLVYLKHGQPVEVMQFTGLFDKNGKEIYEGDILRQFHGQPYECVYEVVWERRGAWWLKLPQKKEAHLEMGDYREGLEVVGNIYENPDLLKEIP